jgi:hypothetical protein
VARANERGRKIHTATTTREQGQRFRPSLCTYDGDGFHIEVVVEKGDDARAQRSDYISCGVKPRVRAEIIGGILVKAPVACNPGPRT